MRVGGKAARFEGFTHTGKDVDSLQVEDELKQVYADVPPVSTKRWIGRVCMVCVNNSV